MTENWIEEGRRRQKEFFATATPDDIRAFRIAHGYEIFSQPPDPDILDFDAPKLEQLLQGEPKRRPASNR